MRFPVLMKLCGILRERWPVCLYIVFLAEKSREGIPVYRHADANSIEKVEEQILAYMDEGYRYIRCHMGDLRRKF